MYLPKIVQYILYFLIAILILVVQKYTEALCCLILLYLYFFHKRINEIEEAIYKLKDHIWRK
jgi:hypothetical protein